ncbi:pyruvate, phosphate dikinase, partial [candidate division KSB1 bacterium]
GKGSNLAEMTNIGVPVPAGFTITTEVCTEYYEGGKSYPSGLKEEVLENLEKVEEAMGAKFGDKDNPLLVSVRSGARVSMPGMMDTVLNIGLNDTTIQGLIAKTNNESFCYDSYRRLMQMYGNVVMGVPSDGFEKILDLIKEKQGAESDAELTVESLKEVIEGYKSLINEKTGKTFPEDAFEQLWGAIGAVFESWDTKRAIEYRRINNIPGDWGTAVSVQTMVFGNMGEKSATGVAFTRNPATGEDKFYGEYLINAQGEDVVAGIRTPQPITNDQKTDSSMVSLEDVMPELYKQLDEIQKNLENHYKDMQDLEFTIQDGRLWMLQTRLGKRTAASAVKIAVDMVREGLISKEEAVLRVKPEQLDQLLHPMIDPNAKIDVLAVGLPASPGAATGRVVFSADDAVEKEKEWGRVILVRSETSPEDIHGMNVAQAILTQRGGMTSHAAVVARGMGKCCVAGCSALQIDYDKKEFAVGDKVIKEGDYITLDGSKGQVIAGEVDTVEPTLSGDFGVLMSWADKFRKLEVHTNADTPHDSKVARDFGAEGIGLTRTEHMFFEGNRIDAMREMILAENVEARKKALEKLLPMQREDFAGIFRVMDGLPVTIRTLDPPLHEFLPHTDEDIKELADKIGISSEKLKNKAESLKELNPMLGHRGCRLGSVYPEITEMQARAILEAAAIVQKEGIKVHPEIMIPLVSHINELKGQKKIVVRVAEEVMKARGEKIDYKVGTMIELPRAVLVADEIAEEAEFFSFGTNDLTQTTFGLSRDDAGTFLPFYTENEILPADPFITVDKDGVGQLMKIGVEKGRKTRKDLIVGICGEHGGDPETVIFCHDIGLDYVSCSPYRVPIARLAAAHAALKAFKKEAKGEA